MKDRKMLETASILTLLFALIILSRGCDWTGVWETNYGQIIFLQSGNYVNGTYTYANGGQIHGTTSANNLVGTWTQTDSAGTLEFTIIEDCNLFSGNWRYGNSGKWSGNWSGKRISAQQLEQHMQDIMDEIENTNQSIQEQIDESNRRISAAFRSGRITLLGLNSVLIAGDVMPFSC
jgi:hypothetical protein